MFQQTAPFQHFWKRPRWTFQYFRRRLATKSAPVPRSRRSAASASGSWSDDPVRASGADGAARPVAVTTVNGALADRPLVPVTTRVWAPGVALAGMRTVTENAPAALAGKVATTTGVVLNVVVSPSLGANPLPDRTTSWPATPWGGLTWTDGPPVAAVVDVVAATAPAPAAALVVLVDDSLVLEVLVVAGAGAVVVEVELPVVVGTVVDVVDVDVVVEVVEVVDVDVVVEVDVVDVDVVVEVDVVVDVDVVDDEVVGVVVLVVLVVDELVVDVVVVELAGVVTTTDSLASLHEVDTALLLPSPL